MTYSTAFQNLCASKYMRDAVCSLLGFTLETGAPNYRPLDLYAHDAERMGYLSHCNTAGEYAIALLQAQADRLRNLQHN